MPITQLTPQEEIDAYIEEQIKRWKTALIRLLGWVGEECRNAAITSHRYQNQTGNLESSTGYVIADNGHIVKVGGFNPIFEGKKGATEGKAYAKSLVSQYPTGICLIVVAGMNYASYVSDRGLDVLDSAELTARQLIPDILKQLDI